MAAVYPSFTPTYHHDQYPAIDPTQPALDCSAKTVLITGGGRGIGKAIAVAFAQAHAKGIVLLGRTLSTLESTAAELRALSPATDVFPVQADITSPASVNSAFAAVLAHYAGVAPDVLVNNAGGVTGVGGLADVDVDKMLSDLALNVTGPLAVVQAFLRASSPQQGDDLSSRRTVINVSSGAAHVPYAAGLGSYAVSKLAGVKLTEYLHYERPEWNVFSLQPGVVETDLSRSSGRAAEDSGRLPAGMAVWLSARWEDARWFSGRFIWVNWDVTELLERKEEIRDKDLLKITLRGWAESVENVVTAEELTNRTKSVYGDARRKE